MKVGSECLWLWMLMKMVAMNTYERNGFEHLWKWWLWTLMKVMALNAYGSECLSFLTPMGKNDSECLYWWKWWLWMPVGRNGSECLWKWWLLKPMKMMALNAYENNGSDRLWKWWLWTHKALNAYDDESGGFERLWKWWIWMPMKMMALNAYGSECLWKRVALNVCERVVMNTYESDGS